MEKETAAILESMGFSAKLLETRSDIGTADIYANDETHSYVIEVKTINDNEADIEKRKEKHQTGELYTFAESQAPRTSVRTVIKLAAKQIEDTKPLYNGFGIIWLHFLGHNYEHDFDVAFNTLYGISNIIHYSPKFPSRQCLYFHESAFYRHRKQLDAVILFDAEGKMQLCLNNHSPNISEFKRSKLFEWFDANRAVFDPEYKASIAVIYIADGDNDRKDTAATLSYLCKKHDLLQIDHIELGLLEAEIDTPSM